MSESHPLQHLFTNSLPYKITKADILEFVDEVTLKAKPYLVIRTSTGWNCLYSYSDEHQDAVLVRALSAGDMLIEEMKYALGDSSKGEPELSKLFPKDGLVH